jgi:rhomboid protease GluP
MSQKPISALADNDSIIQSIISQILSEIHQRFKLDLIQDPVAMERIDESVRKALLDLDSKNEVLIDIPFISANAAGPIHFEMVISRESVGLAPLEREIIVESSGEEFGSKESTPQRSRIELPDRKPLVTSVLMVFTIILYTIQIVTDITLGYDLPAALGMKSNELIIEGQYWRLITPMFLHGSFIHLGFNMYALNILGRRVERIFGNLRFLGLYVVAGITGNVFSFFFTAAPSLGSSTAIFGLLGAEAIFIYHHRMLFGEQFRRALRQIIQVAGINILIGLSPGIDNWGHIGGLLGGAIFTWFGGPQISLINKPPLIKLKDESSFQKSILVFLAQIVILIGLVLGIISLKT